MIVNRFLASTHTKTPVNCEILYGDLTSKAPLDGSTLLLKNNSDKVTSQIAVRDNINTV